MTSKTTTEKPVDLTEKAAEGVVAGTDGLRLTAQVAHLKDDRPKAPGELERYVSSGNANEVLR